MIKANLFLVPLAVLSCAIFPVTARAGRLTGALPKGDLEKISRVIGTQVNDGNISNYGVSKISARKILVGVPGSKAELEAFAEQMVKSVYKDDVQGAFPADAKLEIHAVSARTQSARETIVKDVGRSLAIGNAADLSNDDNIDQLVRKSWVVLAKLPFGSDTLVVKVKTSVKDEGSDDGSRRQVFYYAFINPNEKTLVQFFVVEGSM